MKKTGQYKKLDQRKPIEHETLAKKATAVIRNMIITGELPPGVKITEFSLADAIGVSRACIREALIILEQEGLLTKVQNHYTQIVRFSENDVDEIYELRLVIETMALRKCIEDKTLNLQHLNQRLDKLSHPNSLKSEEQVIDWLEEDMAFHRDIVTASGNNRAVKLWESLSNQVIAMPYRAYRIHQELISSSTDTHGKIIQAVMQGDSDEAVKRLQSHITTSIDWVKKAIALQEQAAALEINR